MEEHVLQYQLANKPTHVLPEKQQTQLLYQASGMLKGSTSITFNESDMSYEMPTEAIQNYAASTNPYIRGLCDEICDHLLMLAEAYLPQTIRPGDLESKFPGYAKGAQEASEIFGIWFDALSYMIDTLTEFEDGLQTVPRMILLSCWCEIFLIRFQYLEDSKSMTSQHRQEVWQEHTHITFSLLATTSDVSA
jgi:hypothetical protein